VDRVLFQIIDPIDDSSIPAAKIGKDPLIPPAENSGDF
jgi:hypothetical protein